MKTDIQSLYRPHLPLSTPADLPRRRFIKQSAALAAASPMATGLSLALAAGTLAARNKLSVLSASRCHLATNTLGFNGERQDPATGLYPLGKGYRVYHPAMMRFHACDTMSPFGQGGINAYAYSLGDPINLRDPSGHFAISSLLIGTIVGSVAGAAISAAAEGVSAAVTHNRFDWKSVAIGAAMGCISGGFGTVSLGASTNVQIGMAIYDTVTSGALDFGLNVAAGANNKQAGINAGIGAFIGLTTFGVGIVLGGVRKSLSTNKLLEMKTIGLTGGAGSQDVNQALGPIVPIYTLPDEMLIKIAHNLSDIDLAKFSQTSRRMNTISKEVFSIRNKIDETTITKMRSIILTAEVKRQTPQFLNVKLVLLQSTLNPTHLSKPNQDNLFDAYFLYKHYKKNWKPSN